MIEKLIRVLRNAGVVCDPRSVSELLWLALELPSGGPTAGPSPSSATRSPSRPGSTGGSGAAPVATSRGSGEQTELQSQAFVGGQSLAAAAGSTTMARRVQLPAPRALLERTAIRRALRPLARKRPSIRRLVIDEEKTAERCAHNDGKLVEIIHRPAAVRWYEALLVTENTPSIRLWDERIGAFAELLSDHGAFRSVRRFALTDSGVEYKLVAPDGNQLGPAYFDEPGPPRLIIFISDATSPAWWNGRIPALLNGWAAARSVVVLNPLPVELWERTWMNDVSASVSTLVPGVENRRLRTVKPWWDLEPLANRRPVPVAGIEPGSLGRWARSVMAVGGTAAPACLLDGKSAMDLPKVLEAHLDQSPRARLERFTQFSSAGARLLAARLSVASPLTLPLMRLIQSASDSGSTPAHLAEVFMGGLLQRITPAEANVTPDEVHYDFVDGLRELLQTWLYEREAVQLLGLVGTQLEKLYPDSRAAKITALVSDPAGTETLPASVRPFAEVARGLLQRLGAFPPAAVAPASADGGMSTTSARRLSMAASVRDVVWSPTGDRIAVLHDSGITIAEALLGEITTTDLPNQTSGLSLPKGVLCVWQPSWEVANPVVHQIVEMATHKILAALRDGGRRRVSLTTVTESTELPPDVAAIHLVFLGGPTGQQQRTLQALKLFWKERHQRTATSAVILLEGDDTRSVDMPVLDWRPLLGGEDMTRVNRRRHSSVGECAMKLLADWDDDQQFANSAAYVYSACAWLSDDRLAVAQANLDPHGHSSLQIVTPAASPSINAQQSSAPDTPLVVDQQSNQPHTSGYFGGPSVSLAAVQEFEGLVSGDACGGMKLSKSTESNVATAMNLQTIQAGLGLPRRVWASSADDFFGYEHHGGGLLVWIQGRRAGFINLDRAPSVPPRIIGVSFGESEGTVHVDVYASDGFLRRFALEKREDSTEANQPLIHEARLSGETILAGATASDNSLAAAVLPNGSLQIFATDSWNPLLAIPLGHDGPFKIDPVVSFSHDNSQLAVGFGSNVLVFETGKLRGAAPQLARKKMEELPNQETAPANAAEATSRGPIELTDSPLLVIPDNSTAGIERVLEAVGSWRIGSVEVSVDITHTYIGDLRVSLRSPAGSEVVLHDRSGGTTDNLTLTYTAATTPALASLAGEPVVGPWRLRVTDHVAADVGKLNSWRLLINPAEDA